MSKFETLRYVIPFEEWNVPIYVYPIGDIHWESSLCSHEKFDEWCNERRKDIAEGKKVYFLGMGDYADFASTSERVKLDSPTMHEGTVEDNLQALAQHRSDQILKKLDFMTKENTIGLLEGNHYFVLKGNITTTQYMCSQRSLNYLGLTAYIRIVFENKAHGESIALKTFWHHGRGGGRTLGASVKHVADLSDIFPSCDIYGMGDDHKKWTYSTSRLDEGRSLDIHGKPIVKEKPTLLVRTGGFLRGYVPGKESYIAKKAFPPTGLGTVMITLVPRLYIKQGKRERYIEILGTS